MSSCRRLHKTGKPWYKWMTRRELRALREEHRAEQRVASSPQSPDGDKDGAKEDSTPAYKDVPEIVVSNGHVVPDIGQSESDENHLLHYHQYFLPAATLGAVRSIRAKVQWSPVCPAAHNFYMHDIL